LTTQATCTVAPNGNPQGDFEITCSGAVSPSYTFTYVAGLVSVKKAPLTVTANDKSMVYGGGLPVFDATLTGFVNGDTPSVISGVVCRALDSSGTPVSSTSPVGDYRIACSGGTAANYEFRYKTGTLTINQANTTIALASAPASAIFGQPLTITANVAVTSPGSGNPTGTVGFKDGSSDISGCNSQPVSATTSTATCTTASLGVGSHTLTASYGGDLNFVGSNTTPGVTQAVAKAASNITLSPTTPATRGQAATFTAVVAATAPGAGTPTGAVTFLDGGTSLGNGQLSVVGGKAQATFSTSTLAVGVHTITASYAGDGNFQTSTTGTAATQYVDTSLSSYPKLGNGAYNLSNVNLSGAYLVGVSLAGASVTGANMSGSVLLGADLTHADLSKSNFKGANLSGVDLSGANLTKTNLSGATGLKTATLSGVIWNNTTCPDGTMSDRVGNTCVGHL